MTLERAALLGLVLVALSCKGEESKSEDEARKGEAKGEASKPAEAKTTPARHLEAFLAMGGSESSEAIAWEHALRTAAVHTGMQSAELAVPGPTGIPKIYYELAEEDVTGFAREAKAHWMASWEPAEGCKHTVMKEPPIPVLPEDALASIPEKMRAANVAMASATHFSVTCQEGRAYDISVAEDGRIIMLIDNSELDIEELLEENRFVGYMNEPDEVPEDEEP